MARFAKNADRYTDVLPEDADTIDVPVQDTDYGVQSIPEFLLRGDFRHQSGTWNYGVGLFRDGTRCLSARAVVIAARRIGPAPTVLDVEDGDFLEIRGEVFQIRDNVGLHDPHLYPVAWS